MHDLKGLRRMPKARPDARCSEQPAKPIGRYMPRSDYYAYNPGLGQGELKCLKCLRLKEQDQVFLVV